MTGWRLGYGVAPAALVPHLTRLQTNATSCTASFIQMAGIAALEGTQAPVDEMLVQFRERRQMVTDRLNAMAGVHCLLPGGAFYAFPRIDLPGKTSKQVADSLLEDDGVAVLAGTAFGAQGEGFLRLSFANSLEELDEGLTRIEAGLKRLQG